MPRTARASTGGMACHVINGGNGRHTLFGENEEELAAVRCGVIRGAPFGEKGWVKRTARLLGLESALRPRGRPGKERKEGANDAKQPKK